MHRSLVHIITGTAVALSIAAVCIPLYGSSTWELGDIFVGIGNGQFQVRSNAGTLKETIAAGNSGDTAGCALDASLNVFLVNTTLSRIIKRELDPPHGIDQTIIADPDPQSIVFAGNGDFYVGHIGGLIRRYTINQNNGNASKAEATVVTVDSFDSFWLDIAADQRTIFYTSGGRTIRSVTVDINPSTNQATFGIPGTFTTLPPPNSNAARALRLLPPGAGAGNGAIIGGLIVADKGDIKRLDASGAVVQSYDAGSGSQSHDDWFALGLDITDVDEAGGDRAFWAGDKSQGTLWRFNLQSSIATAGPVPTGAPGSLRGLCLNGEPTTGQYSAILTFNPAVDLAIRTATFAAGTPAVEEHSFSIVLDCLTTPAACGGTLQAVVNAREAVSDGICSGGATNTNDVDCGFVTYFSTDPELPKAAAYVHGRGAYYHVRWLTVNPTPPPGGPTEIVPSVVVRISSDAHLADVEAAAGTCAIPAGPSTVQVPRALRILRDLNTTAEDQFAEDVTDSFYIDEFGTSSIRTNRFIMAARCATGTSVYLRPADGRTFKAGNSIPVELNLADAAGNPITNATTFPHSIATTIGFQGQILFTVGTPGSSPLFWNQIQPGTYKANLDTTGLAASNLPYNFCVSDRIDPPDPNVEPMYHQKCFTFFLK
jgi:hypothetical protein